MFAAYRRWIVGGLLLLAFALLVWFAGPLIAFAGVYPFETVTARLVTILLGALAWALLELVRYLVARRRNQALVQGLSGADDPLQGGREEERALQKRFEDALSRFNAGGASKRRGLYELPWYMFIGAPGSGKTTALKNGGLRFPLGASGADEVQGIGGTRFCEWLFTEQAVLIDTAGRYTTQESNAAVDRSGWNTFIALLRKHRPRQPINGVLVTVSISDLLSSSAAERERYARTLRQRCDELQRDFGMQVPVYVLLTKSDLLGGFNEFFASFDAEQRAQVLGVTFPLDLRKREPVDVRATFDAEVPGLLERLNGLLLVRLQEERDRDRRARLYPFPQEFAAACRLVSEFLDSAFSESRYLDKLLVRGVYFTSGTQQGAPIDRLLGSLHASLSMGAGASARSEPLTGAAKSFFLRRLLTDVVFREAGLAGHSEARERRRRVAAWAAAGVLIVVSLGLIGAWTWSWRLNGEGLEAVQQKLPAVRKAVAAVGPPAAGDLPQLVEALNEFIELPSAVHAPVDQPPLRMRYGLYQGLRVEDQAGERYRHALQHGLLPRISLQLESVMAAPGTPPEGVYAALKTYLMLYRNDKFSAPFFTATVADLWRSMGFGPILPSARTHLDQLARTGDLQAARFHPMNEELVRRARERVAAISLVDRAYSLLRLSTPAAPRELRVSEVMGPVGVGLFERASGVPLSDPLPYAFTREGYFNSVKPRVNDLVGQLAAEEEWVLGSRASGLARSAAAELEAAVLARFLGEYQAAWAGLLTDVRLRRLDTTQASVAAAQALSLPDSPLRRFVAMAADQTRLGAPTLKGTATAAVEAAAKDKAQSAAGSVASGVFGQAASQAIATLAPQDPVKARERAVQDHFAGLHRLAGEGGASPEMDAAAAMLGEIANELVAVQQKMSSGAGVKEIPPGLLKAKSQADRFAPPVAPVLKTLADFGQREAVGGVRKEVKSGVGSASAMCMKSLPGRYPLVRGSAQDAGVQDFVNVFKAGGELDAFFNGSLASFVDKSAGVWRLKGTGEGAPPVSAATLRQFQNADAIRTAFMNGGSTPGVTADVSVVGGEGEVTLEYDGTPHKLRLGAPGVRLAWPARPGARLLVQNQQAVAVEGPWALFRLVDRGTPDPLSSGDRIRVSYGTPGGARTTLEFRAGSAAFNPFRLRELEGFNCPRE